MMVTDATDATDRLLWSFDMLMGVKASAEVTIAAAHDVGILPPTA